MTEQEKQKYYGNEAFETIFEKTKKEYAPQLIDYAPLDEKTLAERISAVLRPVYDKAIAAIFRGNQRQDVVLIQLHEQLVQLLHPALGFRDLLLQLLRLRGALQL